MKKYDWEDYLDEDITDEITLLKQALETALKREDLGERRKQNLIDDLLDKLNSFYDEQTKRSTSKGSSRRT
jgi:hypothetical protein